MDWKDEDAAELETIWERRGCLADVADRAVELAAARGGTMTAEDGTIFAASTEDGGRVWVEATGEWGHEGGNISWALDALAAHVIAIRSALGARNAVLEAEVKRLSECAAVTETMAARRERDEARAEAEAARERLEKRTQELKAENGKLRIDISGHTGTISEQHDTITGLQERLSAADEGNRELVRRAQQAEALLERERDAARMWSKRAIAAVEERDGLKARCATLSAAGQVLSAHVDKADGECCYPAPMTHSGQRLHTLDCPVGRYPCSATCTHDDAAKPGHPEHEEERSDAVKQAAAPDPVGQLALKAGAKQGREIASYRAGYEQGCDDMRAACLEAVMRVVDAEGAGNLADRLKSAIEGAAP